MLTIATKFHNATTRTTQYQVLDDTQVTISPRVRKRLCGNADCRCELRVINSTDPRALCTAFVHTR